MSAMRTIVRRPSGGINWSVILWILATARTSSQFSLSSPPDATSRTPPTPTNEGPFALVDGTNNDDGGDDDDNVLLPASGRFRLTLFRSAPNTDDIDGNNDCPPIDMPVPMAVSGSGAGPVSVSMFMSMSSPLALPPLSLQRCDGIFLYGREIVHSESDATLATLEVLTMDQPDRNRAPHVLHRPAATIATTLWDATLVIEPDQPAETTQQQHTSHGCFVAMNRFRVRDRCKALFEARWANRRSKLSLQPGFVGFSLLRKRKHNHNGNGNGNGNDNGEISAGLSSIASHSSSSSLLLLLSLMQLLMSSSFQQSSASSSSSSCELRAVTGHTDGNELLVLLLLLPPEEEDDDDDEAEAVVLPKIVVARVRCRSLAQTPAESLCCPIATFHRILPAWFMTRRACPWTSGTETDVSNGLLARVVIVVEDDSAPCLESCPSPTLSDSSGITGIATSQNVSETSIMVASSFIVGEPG